MKTFELLDSLQTSKSISAETQNTDEQEGGLNRRDFLTLSASAGLLFAAGSVAQAAAPLVPITEVVPLDKRRASQAPVQMPRPQAPYRVWAGAEFIGRNTDAYSNMTLDGGGDLDPRIANVLGKLVLDDIEGTQTTNPRGSYYWENITKNLRRTRAAVLNYPPMISSGVVIRSWGGPVPEKKPDNEKWMLEGLRAGKKANSNLFIAAWVTEPNEQMYAAGREGLVDLFIIDGFTHAHPQSPNQNTITWEQALARCDAFKKAGLLNKTIYGFSNLDRDAVMKGEQMSKEWLEARIKEIKQRYPEMPGIAFDQTTTNRSNGTFDLIRTANQLSAQLWPSA